jgi:hypothetical protein
MQWLFPERVLSRQLFSVSISIVIANFLIGIFAPTTGDFDDEITFLDALWRVVVGQHYSVDFHDPHGFGPYQLGAVLWDGLGPHYNVMRVAIFLFNLLIVLCGCISAKVKLAQRTELALLFCITLAFQISAPSVFNKVTELGMAGFYDRQIVAALAVLFVLTFSDGPKNSTLEDAVEVALGAVLLNILFLIKISGPVLGLLILLGGCFRQSHRVIHQLLKLFILVIAFAAITVMEFKVTGLQPFAVFQDYELSAHARLAYSFSALVRGVMYWPFVASLFLLFLFGSSHAQKPFDWRRLGLVIGTYAACQYALNITNGFGPNVWVAPAAIVTLVAHRSVVPDHIHRLLDESEWRWRFSPSRLAEISVRDAIPYVIFAVVLVPQAAASIAGLLTGVSSSLGLFGSSIVISAEKTIAIRCWFWDSQDSPVYTDYANSINDAVKALAALNLGNQTIANLDFANPFPVLFLAPPPNGIQVWWDTGFTVPRGATVQSRDVIGDACVVVIPATPNPDHEDISAQLFRMAQPLLASDFKIIYQDRLWTFYKRTENCPAARS